jgi:hypothetical protein
MIWKVTNTEILWKALGKVKNITTITLISNLLIKRPTHTSNKRMIKSWELRNPEKAHLEMQEFNHSFKWRVITNQWNITTMDRIVRVKV